MSTSDSASDSDDEEQMDAEFESKLEKFQKMHPDCVFDLNKTQKKQLKAMFSAMVDYEEASGIALNDHQEFIFQKVYIDEPLSKPRHILYYIQGITLESDNDVDALCFALKQCTSGKDLSLDRVKSSSIGSNNIDKICNVIAKSKYIKSLSWRKAEIDDKTTGVIAKALSSSQSLEFLNLHENNIGDVGAKELASMLRASRTIDEIDLSFNRIGDSGAQHLSDALIRNVNIRQLRITKNRFGENGSRCMVKALLHNHGCSISSTFVMMYNMKRFYLNEDRHLDFDEFDYAIDYLSELNTGEESVEEKAFKKAMLIQKSSQPGGDFEAWWFPVFHDTGKGILKQLWETALKQVEEDTMLEVIRKRKKFDLVASDKDIQIKPDGSKKMIQNSITKKKIKTEEGAAEESLAAAAAAGQTSSYEEVAFSGTVPPLGPRRGRSAYQPPKKAFKVENPIDGEIFCPHPQCKAPMILSEKGCNIQTCTNTKAHGGSYYYFCCHCKSACEDYISDCKCSPRNDMVTRLREQKRRNELSEKNPIVIDSDDYGDDDGQDLRR